METKTTSSFKIILFGQLMVNLPVSVIIALVIRAIKAIEKLRDLFGEDF